MTPDACCHMHLITRALGGTCHRQAMREEIPVFGHEIEEHGLRTGLAPAGQPRVLRWSCLMQCVLVHVTYDAIGGLKNDRAAIRYHPGNCQYEDIAFPRVRLQILDQPLASPAGLAKPILVGHPKSSARSAINSFACAGRIGPKYPRRSPLLHGPDCGLRNNMSQAYFDLSGSLRPGKAEAAAARARISTP